MKVIQISTQPLWRLLPMRTSFKDKNCELVTIIGKSTSCRHLNMMTNILDIGDRKLQRHTKGEKNVKKY